MRRLTTPEHRFTLPYPVTEFKRVLITYSQGGRNILNKTLEDAETDGNTVIIRLTQEETKLFTADSDVSIQVRVLTGGGDALASSAMRMAVFDVLNDEVLT